VRTNTISPQLVNSDNNSPDKISVEADTAAETSFSNNNNSKKDDFFIADNTHLIVEEKLEKIRIEKD